MKITAAQLHEHFAELNISSFEGEVAGMRMLLTDAGTGSNAGVALSVGDGEMVVSHPIQTFVSNSEDPSMLIILEDQTLGGLVARLMEGMGVKGKQERRRVISVRDALAELHQRGFKAYVEHTGGGTFTVYCNKDGNGTFAIGPVSRFVGSEPVLSDEECYWGMDGLYADGEVLSFDAQDTGDIYNMFDMINKMYDDAITTGLWPAYGGGFCNVLAPGNPDFEPLPKQLAAD